MTVAEIPLNEPLGGLGLQDPFWADTQVGPDATKIREAWHSLFGLSGSRTVGQRLRSQTAQKLSALFVESQVENWDGEGSAPVEPSTFAYAQQFLSILPPSVPTPDVYVDPDGEIDFEWDRGPRLVFSVSVGRDGTLTYAGLFGSRKSYGTDTLTQALPAIIRAHIDRVLE